MAPENKQLENQPLPASAKPSVCGIKAKSYDGTFLENWKAHFGDFVNIPMDEHKACFKNTVTKVVNMAKIEGDKKSEAKEGENSPPVQHASAK